ncbi:MAG: aminoglycoside phosphotransferase family protein [Myxococcales bacterium]|nr:aminoglycoside phosphotransferase family protein [Myxococcales bacterium]USN50926.1 MAG: aminoglycoside phosphotransferase family protein [Myxococcales bacterium]
MLEKPDIADELIISHLKEHYHLHTVSLTFLPLGDRDTAVYRIVADHGLIYFLKLRKDLDEIAVSVPIFLKSKGFKEIIAPIESKSQQGWVDFGDYKMILYPFVEGKNGFEIELSDLQKQKMGRALKALHEIDISLELKKRIPKETFSPKYRDDMKSFFGQMTNKIFKDPIAAKLNEFIKVKRNVINHLIDCAEKLAFELRQKPLEFVLCHTDIHGGNILISNAGEVYIVDWDAPMFAPKERDLMFIGGGIDDIWKTKRDESMFYKAYQKANINLSALAYYRYERIIVDLVEICNQLLLTEGGGADREQAYQWFILNFKSGGTIDRAKNTRNI